MMMETTETTALEYIWTFGKVIIAFSPIIAIASILIFAREDDEVEIAKRKVKCAKS